MPASRSRPRPPDPDSSSRAPTPPPSALLRAAEALKTRFGPRASAAKRPLLRTLTRLSLPRPAELLRLHELLCFWRAYPDDATLLAQVERMLRGFASRPDLRAHAARLADSGIAGTPIRFPFFAPTARWLAERWPERIAIDWDDFQTAERLVDWLPLLAHEGESPALDELDLPVREWIRRMRGPAETDATFLARRFAQLPLGEAGREILYDELDVPLVLSPADGTPSRTHAKVEGAPRAAVAFQRRALSRARPSPADILRLRPRVVREVSPREGERLVDLAREAMVTRSRDLDVFSYGDPRDVRMVDFGGGLQFACIGAIPERRLLLEAVYGYLTLKNGVPVGYVLTSALFSSSELAYNVFDTYRGTEAGAIYGRVLAMTRHLFGSDTFTIFPYQLGEGNDEAIESGAWWFYQKMGFQPRAHAAVRLMNQELARTRRDPGHRSTPGTLRRLARANLYLQLGGRRGDVMGELELPNVGLHVMKFLAERFGSDRERAKHECARQAAALLGVDGAGRTADGGEGWSAGGLVGWSAGERLAWERWAPLVLILPGIARWSAAERRSLAEVVRAKGGRRESEFVRRFDAHRRLRRAIVALAVHEPRGVATPRSRG